MVDVGYVLLMVGFVVLAALFTIGCDKLIGPDEAALAGEERDEIEAAGKTTYRSRDGAASAARNRRYTGDLVQRAIRLPRHGGHGRTPGRFAGSPCVSKPTGTLSAR